MKAIQKVLFKGVDLRQGGIFKNSQGQEISYNDAYVVRFDENGSEKKVKFSGDNKGLYTKFQTLKQYQEIDLQFDITIQNSGCKIEIIDFNISK